MDDNFANLTHGIEEGRVLFDNLKKTVAYTATHLWPEAVPAILSLLFAFPLGLQPLIVLTIDLGTELGPAVSLAKETMVRPHGCDVSTCLALTPCCALIFRNRTS